VGVSLPAEGECVGKVVMGRDGGGGGTAVTGRGGGGRARRSHARGSIPGLTPRSPSGAGLALPDRFRWGRGRRWWRPVNSPDGSPAIGDREPKHELSGREATRPEGTRLMRGRGEVGLVAPPEYSSIDDIAGKTAGSGLRGAAIDAWERVPGGSLWQRWNGAWTGWRRGLDFRVKR